MIKVFDVSPLFAASWNPLFTKSLLLGSLRLHIPLSLVPQAPLSVKDMCLVHIDNIDDGIAAKNAGYKHVVISVPGGAGQAEVEHRSKLNATTDAGIRLADDLMHNHELNVSVLVKGALASKYETYVHPGPVCDITKEMLSIGCQQVIWEETTPQCTPRLIENIIKTSVALGNDSSCIGMILSQNDHVSASIVQRALHLSGISFHTSSAPNKSVLLSAAVLNAMIEYLGDGCPTALLDAADAFTDLSKGYA